MADEDKKEEAEEGKKNGLSPLIKKLLVGGIFLLLPAILGILAFKLVISPLLAPPGVEDDQAVNMFPAGTASVDIEDIKVSVAGMDPSKPFLLMFSVTLLCDSEATAQMLMDKTSLFKAKINELHRGRTMSEVNDVAQQGSLMTQMEIESNKLLKNLGADKSQRVLQAEYTDWMTVPI